DRHCDCPGPAGGRAATALRSESRVLSRTGERPFSTSSPMLRRSGSSTCVVCHGAERSAEPRQRTISWTSEGTHAAEPVAYRRDWMPMSRVLILLVFTVSSITALGQAQPASRPSRPVAIDLSHINALNRNVVAADFNGDGIIDLAGS